MGFRRLTAGASQQDAAMPRKLRVEYPGAIYHVMSRGDRREDIYLNDVDRHDFLSRPWCYGLTRGLTPFLIYLGTCPGCGDMFWGFGNGRQYPLQYPPLNTLQGWLDEV